MAKPKQQQEKRVNPRLVERYLLRSFPPLPDDWALIARCTIMSLFAHSNKFFTVDEMKAGRVEFTSSLSVSQLQECCGADCYRTVTKRLEVLRDRYKLLTWRRGQRNIAVSVAYDCPRLSLGSESGNDDYLTEAESGNDDYRTEPLPHASEASPRHFRRESGNRKSELGNGRFESGNRNPSSVTGSSSPVIQITDSVFSGLSVLKTTGDAGSVRVSENSAEQKKQNPQTSGASLPNPHQGTSSLDPRVDSPVPSPAELVRRYEASQTRCLQCEHPFQRDPKIGGRICDDCRNGKKNPQAPKQRPPVPSPPKVAAWDDIDADFCRHGNLKWDCLGCSGITQEQAAQIAKEPIP